MGPEPPFLAHPCKIPLVPWIWWTEEEELRPLAGKRCKTAAWKGKIMDWDEKLGQTRSLPPLAKSFGCRPLILQSYNFRRIPLVCLPPQAHYKHQSTPGDYDGHTANLNPHNGMQFERQGDIQDSFLGLIPLCASTPSMHMHTHTTCTQFTYVSLQCVLSLILKRDCL